VNSLTLHYLEWGKLSASPIVCVHGYTASAQQFNPLARHLQDRYRILALDVRGHGESAWSPGGAYQYADQASDLAEFAHRLGLDKFVLIGISMGGITAMTYAAEHAARLLGLVIDDIGPDVERGSQRTAQRVGSQPEEFATLEDAMEYGRACHRTSRGGARRTSTSSRSGYCGVVPVANGYGRLTRPISASGSSTARPCGRHYGRCCRRSPAQP
jgi:pimeloyl-ACP methyl ester carboxylesterase